MIRRGDNGVRRGTMVLAWMLAACARAEPASAVPPTVGTEHEDFVVVVTDEQGDPVAPAGITCDVIYVAPREDLGPLVEPCLSWGPDQAFLTGDPREGRLILRVLDAYRSHRNHGQVFALFVLRAVVAGRRSYPIVGWWPERGKELRFRLPARGIGGRPPVLSAFPRYELLPPNAEDAKHVDLSVGFVDPSGGPVQVEWHFRGRTHGMHEARTSVGLFYGEQTIVVLGCTMECVPAFLKVNLPPRDRKSIVVEPPSVHWDHFPKAKPPPVPKK